MVSGRKRLRSVAGNCRRAVGNIFDALLCLSATPCEDPCETRKSVDSVVNCEGSSEKTQSPRRPGIKLGTSSLNTSTRNKTLPSLTAVVNARLHPKKTVDLAKHIMSSQDVYMDTEFLSLQGLPIIDMKTLDGYKVIKDTGFLKRHSSNPDDNLAVTLMDRGSIEREAAILRKVSGHENIPRLHGVTSVDGDDYGLVYDIPYGDDMESMRLRGELEEFSFRERIHLALQLCGAVAYLHQNGIIHQSICPDNIIIEKNTLRLTLIGFGNAFLIDDAAKPRGHGVPKYMAPESVLDSDTASFKADVWSLGMVLALLFTGLQPYHKYQPANIAKFQEMHADNHNRPRYAHTRSNNVEMKHYIGQGKAMEQVGTLINLAVCPTQGLRPCAKELLGTFAMLLTTES